MMSKPCLGWFDIEAIPTGEQSFEFPERTLVLHWHGETFDLPSGAVHLARSVACENQAFQLGSKVIGLQFHLEMMPENVAAIIDNCRGELIEGEFVQDEASISGVTAQEYAQTNQLMEQLLGYLTQGINKPAMVKS